MSLAPQDFLPQIFPHIGDWVANLENVFPGKQVKPYFAQWEVLHLLSLAVLGGSSILMNLRLIGYGISDESPSEIHRNMARWMHVGVIGIIVTGLLIGSSNAERLYTSQAFTAKMIGLAAAIILTYGVTLPALKNDGRIGVGSRVASLVGMAVFLAGAWVFLTAALANPGLWHVIFAAGLIALFVTRGATRLIYLATVTMLVLAHQVTTHFIIKPDDYERLDPVNKAFGWAFFVLIATAALVQIVRAGRGEEGGPFVRAMAYFAILVWVMTAAAGRWLAFA